MCQSDTALVIDGLGLCKMQKKLSTHTFNSFFKKLLSDLPSLPSTKSTAAFVASAVLSNFSKLFNLMTFCAFLADKKFDSIVLASVILPWSSTLNSAKPAGVSKRTNMLVGDDGGE